ncbi:MAG TPA: hypothetical protein V6C85_23595, partial [Allocoleopsis sp.]
MNQIQELLQPVHRCFCTLNHGRSPAYWQRNLLHQTTPLSFGQRDCNWVKDLENVQVKLQKEPLLGSSLPALTGGCSNSPERSSTATQSPDTKLYPGVFKRDGETGRRGDGETGRRGDGERRKQSFLCRSVTQSLSHPELATSDRILAPGCPPDAGVLPQKAVSSQLSEKEHSPSSACVPLRLQPKAPAALLCNLAKQSGSERSFQEPACDQKPHVAGLQPDRVPRKLLSSLLQQPIEPRSLSSSTVSHSPACLDAASQQHWRQNLTRRTADSLRREKPARYVPERKPREPLNGVEAIDLTEQNGGQSALPMDTMRSQSNPWLLPLDGVTAPSDVLAHLANPLPTSSQTQASK